jgi:FKBP-type peptidyl-prolyl cis-trans isomerase FkpA/FKBP-type peptidyl-prolyl cis-trans isomerase FklB
MKKHQGLLALALCTSLVVSVAAADAKKAGLTTDKKKFSYAVGQQIGRQLKGSGLDIDTKVLGDSIADVLAGKESKLTADEMRAAMGKANEAAQAKMESTGKENKAKGDKFLAENKSKAGVKTTASGLQYQVVKEGSGKSPAATDTVKVHYEGKLIDGTKFDSSYDRNEPAEFPLNGVIKGWTEGLQLMKVGGKMKLYVPSDLAYGPQGRPSIPPNSVLIFDVELLEIANAK